ncbi:FG-GAP repeat domain-containing protein [Tunturiibacter gelidiferens]|uniref:FG-GAP repeat domain-containing protein n=1 Tax=Tunturiibacter gelidiferens TaxID=3069689 RepID=UPI003D9BA962
MISSLLYPTAMVVAGTTNGGNNIDLAIVTDKTTVLLGDGKGGFTQGQSCALNGTLFPIPGSNGQTDLISELAYSDPLTINPSASSVTRLTSNGDGTFQATPTLFVQNVGFVPADLNGDGVTDILTFDYQGNLVTALGRGNGTFTVADRIGGSPNFAIQTTPLVAADFTGDGIIDAAIVTPGNGSPRSNVWIFGDTLHGDKRVVDGSDPRMVHNTIGISTCQGGKWKIDYSIRQGAQGEMQSFFDPPRHDGTWYWALDGFVYRNELWISLLCIRATPKNDAAAIGFETCGTDLAHVTGIDGAPKSWKVEYQPLVPESAQANPSATAVVEGKYAYFVALAEKSRADILTRIPLDGLHAAEKNLQYLSADGTWKAGIDAANAKTLIAEGAAELSIRYHPELKKWVSIMVSPNMLSNAVFAYGALAHGALER